MKWFKQCLGFFQRKKVAPEPDTLESYTSAGTIFTDDIHVLAGYQPNKKTPFISGIGGTRNRGETYLHTAIRETIEELFEVHKFPYKLMYDIIVSLKPTRVIQNGKYVIVVFTFDHLLQIMSIIKKYNLISPMYDTLPTNMRELIFERKSYKSAEIAQLVLLPAIKNIYIDINLINDIRILYE